MILPADALPESMLDLADVIGLPATLAIIELRAGCPLKVPRKATVDHWLVQYISFEALTALVNFCGGDTIEIPRCVVALRTLKEHAIMADSKTMSNIALAQTYKYTVRGIRKLKRRVEAQLNSDQGDFFR